VADGMASVRVLIVDDAEDSRNVLRRALALEPDIEVVGEAGSGKESVSMAEEARPDVVLMDVRMPQGDGIDATRTITRRFPEIRVLALTAYDDKDSVRDMLDAGATGYLLKGAPVRELVAAVRKARKGEGGLDQRVLPGAVDDLRRLIQEERQRRADAERLARNREEFIQVLGHELRTPLAVISGTLRLLREGQLAPEQAELVSLSLVRVGDLERVISGLEMIGEGPADRSVTTNPARAVAEALATLEEAPDAMDLADDTWPGIRPQHLGRVATELVANAIRHGRRPVAVRAYRQGREGVLEVSDRGDFQPDPQLFAPFVQEDMSAQRRQGGLGLGLFVASRLCESSGGRLDLGRSEGRTVAEARFLLAS
jgi:DNA-binding NarL/FixJ family response regulator/anti-sigma regulatory factor (Ser/Thr protein kinase)